MKRLLFILSLLILILSCSKNTEVPNPVPISVEMVPCITLSADNTLEFYYADYYYRNFVIDNPTIPVAYKEKLAAKLYAMLQWTEANSEKIHNP